LRKKTDQGFVFRGNYKHLDYWRNHSLPVIVVLYDPDSGACYWQAVSDENLEYTRTAWKMIIPRNQVLDSDSKDDLRTLVKGTPFEQGMRILFLHKPFMDAIGGGGRVILEAEDWVNKSLNRTTPKVTVFDEDGDEVFSREWPTTYTPGLDFADSLRALFPWAELQLDEEFYLEYEEWNADEWSSRRPIHDFIYRDERLEEVPEELRDPGWDDDIGPEFIPYEENGETAQYRFELTLNEVGKAFMTLDEYLQDPPRTFTLSMLMCIPSVAQR
jgi:hypothetical protein